MGTSLGVWFLFVCFEDVSETSVTKSTLLSEKKRKYSENASPKSSYFK